MGFLTRGNYFKTSAVKMRWQIEETDSPFTHVALQKLCVSLTQVWFQNCRARHKKHVSPNHTSSSPMTSLQPSRLSQPAPTSEELQYTAYGGPEGSMLSALHSFIDSEHHTSYCNYYLSDCQHLAKRMTEVLIWFTVLRFITFKFVKWLV